MDILVLDTTSKSLRVVLGEAITTSQLDITCHYADVTSNSVSEGNAVANSNGLTIASILSAPAASTRRVVRNITLYNADTVTHTVSIMVTDTATNYLVTTISLGTGASWSFGEGQNRIGESTISFYQDSSATTSLYGALIGNVNSLNTAFTVSKGSYHTGTLIVYLNGQQLTPGGSNDWTETTPTSGIFAFATAPTTGDVVTVTYQYLSASMSSGDADLLDGQHGNYYAALSIANTFTGSVVFRTVGSDPKHATPGSRPSGVVGEPVFYSAKLYFCTNATTPTWELITSA